VLSNRVGWACTYLRKAGLISSPQRTINVITDDGLAALAKKPGYIDVKFLSQYPAFQGFREDKNDSSAEPVEPPPADDQKTPEEIIGLQSRIIDGSIAHDLLDLIAQMEPDAFEQLVVDLLLAMGYGGSEEDAGKAIGQSSDGGIDGIIKEDVLGLDSIYVQAKRWQGTVPVKEVRDFAGALLSKKSNKGVFITTSTFPENAHDFVQSIDRKIILIDGTMLAELMIKFNLGVKTKATVRIKEIDSDYFPS
jgi:restriction system protein